jgi:hypothetical protein
MILEQTYPIRQGVLVQRAAALWSLTKIPPEGGIFAFWALGENARNVLHLALRGWDGIKDDEVNESIVSPMDDRSQEPFVGSIKFGFVRLLWSGNAIHRIVVDDFNGEGVRLNAAPNFWREVPDWALAAQFALRAVELVEVALRE